MTFDAYLSLLIPPERSRSQQPMPPAPPRHDIPEQRTFEAAQAALADSQRQLADAREMVTRPGLSVKQRLDMAALAGCHAAAVRLAAVAVRHAAKVRNKAVEAQRLKPAP